MNQNCNLHFSGIYHLWHRVSGSLYGRAIGVGLCYLWKSVNGTPYPLDDAWRWMDPGVWAAIGAAGLLGGVNRIDTASTVIVVRLTLYTRWAKNGTILHANNFIKYQPFSADR